MGEKIPSKPLTEEEGRFLAAIADPEKRKEAVKILIAAGLLGASPPAHSARHQA